MVSKFSVFFVLLVVVAGGFLSLEVQGLHDHEKDSNSNSNNISTLAGIQFPRHMSFNAVSTSTDCSFSSSKEHQKSHSVDAAPEKEVSDDDGDNDLDRRGEETIKLNLKNRFKPKESLMDSTKRDLTRIQTLHKRIVENKNQNSISRLKEKNQAVAVTAEEFSGQLTATLESGVSLGSGEYLIDVLCQNEHEKDGWYWNETPSGLFKVSSAYNLLYRLKLTNNDSEDDGWKMIWGLQATERVKLFIWTVGHDAILSNVNRKRRHLSVTDQCPSCASSESSIHILRDCHMARRIWNNFLPSNWSRLFYGADLKRWLKGNLSVNFSWNSIPWQNLFSLVCWWLWKWRNDVIFSPGSPCVDKFEFIISKASEMKKVYEKADCMGNVSYQSAAIYWKPPDVGWVKINSDGASKGNPGLASTGGLIRDETGNWQGGFLCNLGICSATLAELWGAYYGLELAWRKGFKKVVMEVDSQVVAHLLSDRERSSHRYAWIIDGCKALLKQNWVVKIAHNFREGNRAADWLANFAGTCSLGHHECDVPPAGLQDLLLDDTSGSSSLRRIRV